MEYIADMDFTELPKVENLLSTDWDGMVLDVNGDGVSYLTLGPEADDILAGIGFSLYYVDEENDVMLLLGTDNDMEADWDNGIFYDNFRGVWGSIDGNLAYMELSYESEDYNLYAVPVLLNGEAYNLQVVYDFNTEEWSILGARQGIDDNGMADKELRLLEEGDELTTIWYMATASGDDEFEAYTVDTFTVTADTSLRGKSSARTAPIRWFMKCGTPWTITRIPMQFSLTAPEAKLPRPYTNKDRERRLRCGVAVLLREQNSRKRILLVVYFAEKTKKSIKQRIFPQKCGML